MTELYLSPDDNIQEAVENLTEPAVIRLKKGIYRQKIEIKADDVTLIGDDRDSTVITYDDYARKIHADGREFNTFRTYTLCISGDRVKLCNITIENSNKDPAVAGQCVALSVNGKSFRAENVNLVSTQDTLFLSPFPDDLVVRYRGFIPHNQLYMQGAGVHLFDNCRICGSVDFIFGCAEAYFRNCEIVSVNDGRQTGFIAAPAHSLKQEHGFYFIGCRIVSRGAAPQTCYLARPWRDFGKSVFIGCRVGDHINAALFDRWNDTERDKTARFGYYALDCGFKPEPVEWSSELTREQANEIIKRCEERFNT